MTAILLLQGCAPPGAAARLDIAAAIAAPASLQPVTLETGTFALAAFVRISAPGAPLTVYLEGDGLAWTGRTRPSADPTPTDPVALKLAAIDASPNVAYLARPCQYVPLDRQPGCRTALWTTHRLSDAVVAATGRALDSLKHRAETGSLHLVGFSGGGGLMVLVAAERDDIQSLRSVAGNLDIEAFTRHHRVSPMTGSRNPAGVAGRVAGIPQLHYVGTRDGVVPRPIAESYRRRAADAGRCVAIAMVDASHNAGWEPAWERLWQRIPACQS